MQKEILTCVDVRDKNRGLFCLTTIDAVLFCTWAKSVFLIGIMYKKEPAMFIDIQHSKSHRK